MLPTRHLTTADPYGTKVSFNELNLPWLRGGVFEAWLHLVFSGTPFCGIRWKSHKAQVSASFIHNSCIQT